MNIHLLERKFIFNFDSDIFLDEVHNYVVNLMKYNKIHESYRIELYLQG